MREMWIAVGSRRDDPGMIGVNCMHDAVSLQMLDMTYSTFQKYAHGIKDFIAEKESKYNNIFQWHW